MPTVNRIRRQKSRLNALDDAKRVDLRNRALDMARKMGPVHKGSPDQQRAAAEQVRRKANREQQFAVRDSQQAQKLGNREAEGQMKRKPREALTSKPPRSNANFHRIGGRPQFNRTGNKRSGEMFKRVATRGGNFHVYESGKRVFVPSKRESGGTGNQAQQRTRRGQETMNELAQARARLRSKQPANRVRRKLFRGTRS